MDKWAGKGSLSLSLSLSLLTHTAVAQDEFHCGGNGEDDGGAAFPGPTTRGRASGPVFADTLRALVVFAYIPETTDGSSCELADGGEYSENWNDPTNLPPWADEIIEDTANAVGFVPQIPGSLTHYFFTMSGGKHLLLGRVYPNVVQSPVLPTFDEGYGCLSGGYKRYNGDFLFPALDSDPNLHFADYDIDGPGQTGDGYVDYVFLFYWSPQSSNVECANCSPPTTKAALNWLASNCVGGTAQAFSNVLVANRVVDASTSPRTIHNDLGATCFPRALPSSSVCGEFTPVRVRNRSKALQVMAHEYFHDIFDEAWPALGVGGSGPNEGHILSAGPYDLMSNTHGLVINPATRLKMGWLKDPVDLPTRTTEWDSTIVIHHSTQSQRQNATVLRTSDVNQYFLIELRSDQTSHYGKTQPPDPLDNCCLLPGAGNGLLISHVYESGQRGWYHSISGTLTSAKPPAFDPEIASGLFNLATFAPDPIRGSDSLKTHERTPTIANLISSQPKDFYRPGAGFSNTWGPHTNPNSNLYSSPTDSAQTVYSGWTIYNVEWAGPGTDSVRFHVFYDPTPPPSSGGADTLRADSTAWDGIVQLTGDLVVPEGSTLNIKEGTKVYSTTTDRHAGGENTSKPEVIVKGRLITSGASGNNVTLSSSRDAGFVHFKGTETTPAAPGDWYGLRFDLAGAPNLSYGYIASLNKPSKLAFTTIANSVLGVEIENLCAPGLESITFSNQLSSPPTPVKHIFLDRVDVALPYGWWDGPYDVQANFRKDIVKWDLESPMNVVATNTILSDRDHPLSTTQWPVGHDGKVDLFIDGWLYTHNLSGPVDYVKFRPETMNDDLGDGWGGIEVHSTAKGTTFRYSEVSHAVDPFFFVYPESVTVRDSKIHHYANYGAWVRGNGNGGVKIRETEILRGSALNADKGIWGVYADRTSALRVKNCKIYDYDHTTNTTWEKSNTEGGGIRVIADSAYCTTQPWAADSISIQGNSLVGPSETDVNPIRSGISAQWACGAPNRKVAFLSNGIIRWRNGVKVTDGRDVQINCNLVKDNNIGFEFHRTAGVGSDPPVRAKWNHANSSKSKTIRVTEGIEHAALGTTGSTTDRGLNKFEIEDALHFYVTQDDGTFTTEVLHAEQNHWSDGSVEPDETAVRIQCEPGSPNTDRIEADSPIQGTYSISCVPAEPPAQAPGGPVGGTLQGVQVTTTNLDPSPPGEPADGSVTMAVPLRSGLGLIAPNPFTSRVSIQFLQGSEDRGTSRLAIYDVSGRLVKTLVSRNLEPGEHRVEWDGKDESGSAIGSGIFFVRFDSELTHETQRLVMLR